MKNENIFPLERNNYFFGKLMTEREYCKEQAYFNNKRRLLNSTLLSSGIICGLTVTKVDGATIAIESGLAIDGLGRELAVPQITVTRLSRLDGFADDRGLTPYVYLCAEYAETQAEPVRSLGDGSGTPQFSYARETVRMFLRYSEPESFEVVRYDKESYRAMSLENIMEQGSRVRLYLAKIHLIRWEDAYEIDKIEQAPFKQYAGFMTDTAPLMTEADVASSSIPSKIRNVSDVGLHNTSQPPHISFGTAEVIIPEGAKQFSLHCSAPIPHNLGLVPVTVTVGAAFDGGTVFGDSGIFDENMDHDYAVRVCNTDGTFVIGVRTNVKSKGETVKLYWSAVTNPSLLSAEVKARILVNPAVFRMRPLETVRITAETCGLPDEDIVWSVREHGGGDITSDGFYTAPVDPGVYTVNAQVGDVIGRALIVVH